MTTKFARELDKRRRRSEAIDVAIKEFREAKPEYAYQAGFFEMQVRLLAADSEESTAELLSALRRAKMY